MAGWTTPAAVIAALGPSAAPPGDDAWLLECCAAASSAAARKRSAAGHVDPPPDEDHPDAAVSMGATLWAVALWRERVAVDGFPSFEDLSSFTPTGGSWGEIRRLLGIGRAAVDGLPVEAAPLVAGRRRRRVRAMYGWRSL